MQCFNPTTSCIFSISHVFTYLSGRLSILEHLNCPRVVLMLICHISSDVYCFLKFLHGEEIEGG